MSGSTPWADLIAESEGSGYELIRAFPRGVGRVHVELRDPAGCVVAGQWHADPEAAAVAARATARTPPPGYVSRLTPRLFTQAGGADRRLPGLSALAAETGAALLTHRPERRGVVRRHGVDGKVGYTKVVRPQRLAALVAAHTRAADTGTPFPRVVAADSATGAVTTAELTGVTLHDLLRRRPRAARDVTVGIGESLGALHARPIPSGLSSHDASAEIAVVDGWLDRAERTGALSLPAHHRERVHRRLTALPAAAPRAPVHRDLHDKQIVLAGDGGVALLDPDTLAAGDPALDLANLVVHLELRARQGLLGESLTRELAAGLVEAYAPDRGVRAAFPAYAAATRLRLAAVYAFRPKSRAAGLATLTEPLLDRLP